MSKWIAILKSGSFKDSDGREHSFSEQTLDTIVSKYDPAEHEAPEVIGHPKANAPAWGWVKRLKREGQLLFYEPEKRVSEFQQMIEKGMFKKRSISLYPDLSLRHVGWLGAQPPAVKGLPDPATFAGGEEAITIEFGEWKDNVVARIFQRLRDFFIEKFGTETADKIISSYDIDDVRLPEPGAVESSFAEDSPEKKAQQARSKKYNIAIKEGGNVTKPSKYEGIDDSDFADPVNYRYPVDSEHVKAALSYWGMPKNREQYTAEEVEIITKRILGAAKKHGIEVAEEKWKFSEKEDDMDKVQELETKLKDREKEIADFSEKDKAKDAEMQKLKKELADEKAKNQRAEFAAFCDSDEMKEKITPAMKPAILDFMEILSGVETYEFAEVDDKGAEKKVKKAPAEAFKDFLKTLPKAVEFSEVATKKKAGGSGDTQSKREKEISDFMEKNKDASYKDAVLAVSKEHPELFAREEG